MLILYTCFQIVGSKALWSFCLLLYVLPTQNKYCFVLSCLVPGGPPGIVAGAEQADPPTAAQNGRFCVLCNPNNSK